MHPPLTYLREHECQDLIRDQNGAEVAEHFRDLDTKCQAEVARDAAEQGSFAAPGAARFSLTCDSEHLGDCIPDCTPKTRGHALLAAINGEDSYFTCEFHHGIHSWVGNSGSSGYMGTDWRVFESTVIVGASGFYQLLLIENDVSKDRSSITLTIQPGALFPA